MNRSGVLNHNTKRFLISKLSKTSPFKRLEHVSCLHPISVDNLWEYLLQDRIRLILESDPNCKGRDYEDGSEAKWATTGERNRICFSGLKNKTGLLRAGIGITNLDRTDIIELRYYEIPYKVWRYWMNRSGRIRTTSKKFHERFDIFMRTL